MPTPQSLVEPETAHQAIPKKAISAPEALNEAYDYSKPSSFSRGLRLDIKGITILLISGTASVDEAGRSIHVGDFRAQTWRTYENITKLLAAEGATWKDIVRTTCYLRDIERDYEAFNEIRTQFFQEQGLNPLPASTGIQAILCRPDLLIEMEAMAIFDSDRGPADGGGETQAAA
ncbi:MAG TPA: Rid family hydrolase [Terriglobia bacterium]|nr:Rid family hydrolase [Terriglobia bacterium]